MEKSRIYRLPPCFSWEVEAMEGWLEQMARDGWLLTRRSDLWGRLAFHRGGPAAYRLIPAEKRGDEEPNLMLKEDLQKLGWDYVQKWEGFFIFRSQSPVLREPCSDPSQLASALERAKGRHGLSLLAGLGVLVFLALAWLIDGPTRFILVFLPLRLNWLAPVILVLLILCLFLPPVLGLRNLSALQKKLRSGAALNRRRDWPRCARRVRLMKAVSGAVLLLAIGFSAYLNFGKALDQYPLKAFPGEPPFATLEELAPEGEEAALSHFTDGYFKQGRGLFIPQVICWWDVGFADYADGTQVTPGIMDIEYIEAPSPRLALAMARDLTRSYASNTQPDLPFLEAVQADYKAAVFHRGVRVILAQGSHVVSARIDLGDSKGNFTFENWVNATLEKLKTEYP